MSSHNSGRSKVKGAAGGGGNGITVPIQQEWVMTQNLGKRPSPKKSPRQDSQTQAQFFLKSIGSQLSPTPQQRTRKRTSKVYKVNLMIVRHAVSEANVSKISAGFLADPLLFFDQTESADQQALKAGEIIYNEFLKQDKPTILISSPMIRTLMTTHYLKQMIPGGVDLPIYVTNNLKELFHTLETTVPGGNSILGSPSHQLHNILMGLKGRGEDFNDTLLFDSHMLDFVIDLEQKKEKEYRVYLGGSKFNNFRNLMKKGLQYVQIGKHIISGATKKASQYIPGSVSTVGGALIGGLGRVLSRGKKPKKQKTPPPTQESFTEKYLSKLDKKNAKEFIEKSRQQRHFIGNFIPITKSDIKESFVYKDEALTNEGHIMTFLRNNICKIFSENAGLGDEINVIIVTHGGVIRTFVKEQFDKKIAVGNCDVFYIPNTKIKCSPGSYYDVGRIKLGGKLIWRKQPIGNQPRHKIKQLQYQKTVPPQQQQIKLSPHFNVAKKRGLISEIEKNTNLDDSDKRRIIQKIQNSQKIIKDNIRQVGYKSMDNFNVFMRDLTDLTRVINTSDYIERLLDLGYKWLIMEKRSYSQGFQTIMYGLIKCGLPDDKIEKIFNRFDLFNITEKYLCPKLPETNKWGKKFERFIDPAYNDRIEVFFGETRGLEKERLCQNISTSIYAIFSHLFPFELDYCDQLLELLRSKRKNLFDLVYEMLLLIDYGPPDRNSAIIDHHIIQLVANLKRFYLL
jgi:broad specificity phosphatase PhoE